MNTDLNILLIVEKAFGSIPRPEHFTDYEHCAECLEHDQTLCAKDRDSLLRKDLGTLGWNPVTFCHLTAKAYLFPRLANELLAEPDSYWGWYGPEFIGLVSNDDFRQYCSEDQRQAVFCLMQHVIETRADLLDSYFCADEFLSSCTEWNSAE